MLIADSLKRFREFFNLSQQQVADALGIHQQAYGRYELNRNIPSAEVIVKISKTFNFSTDYLLGLSDKPNYPEFSDSEISLLESLRQIISESKKNQSA